MQIFVLSAFPEIFRGPLDQSIVKIAQEKGLIKINIINLIEFTEGNYKQLDDYSYGGGAGMVLKPEPLSKAFESLPVTKGQDKTLFIYMSPQGIKINQKTFEKSLNLENIVILCGRYKGVDQRIIDKWIDVELSLGDYVLSGGELPAMVFIEGITRLIPGVLGNIESANSDSFSNGLLGYPVYTRPSVWDGNKVPEVLLSGDHKKIDEWRHKKALDKTTKNRKDLLKNYLELKEKKDE